MPGAPPDWIELTGDAVYAGRIGDGGLPYASLVRIDRVTLAVEVVVFPTGLDDTSSNEWLPSWVFADESLLPLLAALDETINTAAFDAVLADEIIDETMS